jgi:hypothetical protein
MTGFLRFCLFYFFFELQSLSVDIITLLTRQTTHFTAIHRIISSTSTEYSPTLEVFLGVAIRV